MQNQGLDWNVDTGSVLVPWYQLTVHLVIAGLQQEDLTRPATIRIFHSRVGEYIITKGE